MLKEHYKELLARREQLDTLILNVEKTILSKEGKYKMGDSEKFQGFKKKMIEDNEKKYGKEVKEKYGGEALNKSNQALLNMTEEEFNEMQELSNLVLKTLKEAYPTQDPAGELGQRLAELHKKWITFMWDNYDKEAHANLAQMYVEDERFKAYYDKIQIGGAEFLRDAILIYTGKVK